MKICKNRHFDLDNSFYCLKLNKFIVTSLFIFVVGIFLLPNNVFASDVTIDNIIELTNTEGLKRDLKPLYINSKLEKAALEKARNILKTDIFAHNIKGQKFSEWVKNEEYNYSIVGENLAIDFVSSEGVLDAWLKSVGHRRNILSKKYKETGIAVIEGEFDRRETFIVVQIFGTSLGPIIPKEIAERNEIVFKLKIVSAEANREESV